MSYFQSIWIAVPINKTFEWFSCQENITLVMEIEKLQNRDWRILLMQQSLKANFKDWSWVLFCNYSKIDVGVDGYCKSIISTKYEFLKVL